MDKLEKALQKARQERGTSNKALPHEAKRAPLPADGANLDLAALERSRIVAHMPRSKEADLFRILRTQILQAMEKHSCKTLAITSPNYGDGKTTTAINLAFSIALDLNQTVLLVDLDIRKPCVLSYLALPPRAGLTDHLFHGVSLPECLTRLSFERLTILGAGDRYDNSSEILRSPQMAALADELKGRYPDRLIIYDMPPILAQDDPLAFLPHIDSVLLVVQEGKTTKQDLKRSMDVLQNSKIVGTVLNKSIPKKHSPRSDSEWLDGSRRQVYSGESDR